MVNLLIQKAAAVCCSLLLFVLLASAPGQAAVSSDNVGRTALRPVGEAPSTSTAFDTTTADETDETPEQFALRQNYPNPFNPSTLIRYAVPRQSHVQVVVYNVLGQEVTTLVDRWQPPGSYEVTFDGSDLTSGVYLLTMKAGDSFHAVRQMVLSK